MDWTTAWTKSMYSSQEGNSSVLNLLIAEEEARETPTVGTRDGAVNHQLYSRHPLSKTKLPGIMLSCIQRGKRKEEKQGLLTLRSTFTIQKPLNTPHSFLNMRKRQRAIKEMRDPRRIITNNQVINSRTIRVRPIHIRFRANQK
ncbi:MAG: hypothetical protein CL912_32915 [Deltaproteobacteria bacterium]|nr:hypothetical protein [Deltaproteobacteria bacterium]